ncbi:diaminopropionate ammonia-lyase [Ethanoligenens sp.]|uniref:diaminopropionate ammonia-lyase n=1 Tax=Ethanoligenens sp. TaxID=2099655 RepID=UPI0039EBC0E5
MKSIKWILNTIKEQENGECSCVISLQSTEKARRFHQSFPDYKPTPLISLKSLARHLGIGTISVKDESKRFGLNAFKVLGATYAMGNYLAKRMRTSIDELPFSRMVSDETRQRIGNVLFYAATDGNHGRAVAWTAQQLKQPAVIYMPKGSSQKRLQNILETGAKASITNLNYDDAVRFASQEAEKHNGIIIQDTAWSGYQEIPTHIMQGYATLAAEAIEQMDAKPTHVFLQAGVGSFAGAVQGYLYALYGDDAPKVVIMEADAADCYYRSAVKGDGTIVPVTGDLLTLMAGLACGEPNPIAFELIKRYSTAFVSCPDWVSAYGMRILGNPLAGDSPIISGESGAAGAGLLVSIMKQGDLAALREKLELNAQSRVLLISTEGDTDPEGYRDVVWRGKDQYSMQTKE